MVSMSQEPPVPAHAALLRDFVNTLDVETGEEAFTSPAALSAWLVEHELTEPEATATADDLARAARLREGLRAALIQHHDGSPERVPEELVIECSRYPVRVSFRDGVPALEPVAGGLVAGVAKIVAATVASTADGTWARLKVCPELSCQWAFLDTSKNRSRTWCTMRVCGNRSKTRSYRARQRASLPTDTATDTATDQPPDTEAGSGT